VWGLDEENSVIITSIEAQSLATKFPFLVKKMKLHKIDNVIIPQYKATSLQLVYQELLKHHDEAVTLEFVEPIIIINQFSCILDLEVEKRILSISLPIGAVYNLDLFSRLISKEMIKVHPSLRYIKVDFIKRKRQMFFKSEKYEFKFLFATGPNYRNSCRYALGKQCLAVLLYSALLVVPSAYFMWCLSGYLVTQMSSVKQYHVCLSYDTLYK